MTIIREVAKNVWDKLFKKIFALLREK